MALILSKRKFLYVTMSGVWWNMFAAVNFFKKKREKFNQQLSLNVILLTCCCTNHVNKLQINDEYWQQFISI